jgi:hemolysin III
LNRRAIGPATGYDGGMEPLLRQAPRRPSLGEEIASSVSHGLALAGAIAVGPVLIVHAARAGDAGSIVGASIFTATVVLLYLASTLYHALPWGRGKRVFRVIDHGAIFLLIAGTYTPFTLGILRGAWGWSLFGVVWGLAVAGIVLEAVSRVRRPVLSTAVYAGMGWLVLVAAKPLLVRLPTASIGWLLAGGLAYTAGIVFYAARRVRYAHFVWHLLVVLGTACHVASVFVGTS